MKKRFILALVINSFLASILFVYADWTVPPATPPTCPTTNPACNTPVNVGAFPQVKQAGLIISNLPPSPGQPGFAVLSGNVGIGTASPSYKLHVIGDGRFSGHIGLSDSGPNAVIQLDSQDVQTNPPGTTIGSRFINYTDTTVNLVATNLYGSLSYAIPRPASGITNTGAAIGMYGIGRADGAGAISTVEGVRGRAESNNATAVITSATGLKADVIQTLGTIATGFGVHIGDVQATTNQFGLYQVGATDRNYFAGNVGIGTASPQAALDVYNGLHVHGGPAYATIGVGLEILKINDSLGTISMINGPDRTERELRFYGTPISFYQAGGEKMRVHSNGNVGIGTTVPARKLDVIGNARITGGLDVGGQRITSVAMPSIGTDAVNKDYVDTQVEGQLHYIVVTRKQGNYTPSVDCNLADPVPSCPAGWTIETSWAYGDGADVTSGKLCARQTLCKK